MSLIIKPKGSGWDLVALGEVMLRLDPGHSRIHAARTFDVWEGGGEYNVARGLSHCFRLKTTVVTALADNPVGRLVEELIRAGGVDTSNIRWREYDGTGLETRVGLNFTERGFGVRAAKGCSDRGHSAASQMESGQVDWSEVLGQARWLHTGGIFAGLSESTPRVAIEAMEAARVHGAIVSYDLNYRPSLWKSRGGHPKAAEVNRELIALADVVIGNEEQFGFALGLTEGRSSRHADTAARLQEAFPNLRAIASTMRGGANGACYEDWAGVLVSAGEVFVSRKREALPIYDRVGGGDSFAAGLIYGFLTGEDPRWSVECGAAHGALTMSTPGDTSMATLDEVMQCMASTSLQIER